MTVLVDYLTEVELATELGVSRRTLARWRLLRKAPAVTRVGRKLLYHRAAIDRWLASRQTEEDHLGSLPSRRSRPSYAEGSRHER